MNVIKLQGLTKKYAPNIGCFDVNLTINQGEVYGFLGPNGAGKSTVIKQMVGFIKSDSGSGTILGYNIWKEPEKIMKSLGYLGGEIVLPDYMTGKEYLRVIARIRGNVDWKYVEKLIDYFALNEKITTKIKKMSKGMKQKIGLIAAFMHKPKILVLDEPTSGLDPLMQEKFNTLIKNCKKDGATIFMSSHIFGEIENTCDKVAVIKKGKIVSEISIKDLKDNAEKKYEIKFVTSIGYKNFLKKEWKILEKNAVTKVVSVTVINAEVNKFLKELTNFDVAQLKELPFNLEEHFIKFYKDEVSFDD